MRGREDHHIVQQSHLIAGHRVYFDDLFHLVTEKRHPNSCLLVGRVDFDCVAADPELTPPQDHVVALVLHVNQAGQGGPLVEFGALFQHQQLPLVLVG